MYNVLAAGRRLVVGKPADSVRTFRLPLLGHNLSKRMGLRALSSYSP